MGDYFKCPICGNEDERYIGYKNGKPYCRRCISFVGNDATYETFYPKAAPINISYDLSAEQKALSKRLLDNYKSGIDSLVHAVCGSGKTEIVLSVIQCAIQSGEKVGFAVPRRDVVIELYDRLKNLFKHNDVVSIYGGHTEKLNADLIVLTTHQLFRYENYFDLLIVDEIDAFPFKGNEVLNSIMKRSIKGRLIMMSATPSMDILRKFKSNGHDVLELFTRFHKYPLPVPKIIENKFCPIFTLVHELYKQIKKNKRCFIFAPTIGICEKIFKLLHIFFKDGNYVHSKRLNRSEIIEYFKKRKYKYLVTTAVLERGVTVSGLNVIVYNADSIIYDSSALIQISGRVGRKKDCPTGEVIYIAKSITDEIKISIEQIEASNKDLQNMF